MDQNLTQNVDILFSNMENFTQNDGLIGKPVVQGDKTFLPVVSVTFGYGGGNSQAKSQQNNTTAMGNNMAGGALGFGAKLSTDAVIIIDKDNVSMVQIGGSSNVSQLIDKIPQIIGKNQNNQQSSQNQTTTS